MYFLEKKRSYKILDKSNEARKREQLYKMIRARIIKSKSNYSKEHRWPELEKGEEIIVKYTNSKSERERNGVVQEDSGTNNPRAEIYFPDNPPKYKVLGIHKGHILKRLKPAPPLYNSLRKSKEKEVNVEVVEIEKESENEMQIKINESEQQVDTDPVIDTNHVMLTSPEQDPENEIFKSVLSPESENEIKNKLSSPETQKVCESLPKIPQNTDQVPNPVRGTRIRKAPSRLGF